MNETIKKNKKKERDLTVRIIGKEKGKVYRHNWQCDKSQGRDGCVSFCHWGQEYWVLEVKCENNPEIKQIYVYSEHLAKFNETTKIWEEITSSLNKERIQSIYDIRYLFKCHKNKRDYKLATCYELK